MADCDPRGKAADYDAKPWQKQFIKQVTEEIISRLDWLGLGKDKPKKMIKMLDYGEVKGLLSKLGFLKLCSSLWTWDRFSCKFSFRRPAPVAVPIYSRISWLRARISRLVNVRYVVV